MSNVNLGERSRFMAFLLRHKPEKGNLILDKEGYTDVESLLKALEISFEDLETIVNTDDKNRYSFNKDKTRIRANQGHSVKNVDIKFNVYHPAHPIYHGTATKYLEGIEKKGLIPGTRQYVHLSLDLDTAKKVSMRHAKSTTFMVIYEVDVVAMEKDGLELFISDNNVVLTKNVPKKYLKRII